jgi:hypothetical protein
MKPLDSLPYLQQPATGHANSSRSVAHFNNILPPSLPFRFTIKAFHMALMHAACFAHQIALTVSGDIYNDKVKAMSSAFSRHGGEELGCGDMV